MPLAVGSRLGSYEVTALIGSGGMGEVWQAQPRCRPEVLPVWIRRSRL